MAATVEQRKELLGYIKKKRDHALQHGGAALETLEPWELEEIVAALEAAYQQK